MIKAITLAVDLDVLLFSCAASESLAAPDQDPASPEPTFTYSVTLRNLHPSTSPDERPTSAPPLSPAEHLSTHARLAWLRPGVRRFLLAVQPHVNSVLLVRRRCGCGRRCCGVGPSALPAANSHGSASSSSEQQAGVIKSSSGSSGSNTCVDALLAAALPHIDPDGQFFGQRIVLAEDRLRGRSARSRPATASVASTAAQRGRLSDGGAAAGAIAGALPARTLYDLGALCQSHSDGSPPSGGLVVVTTADRSLFGPLAESVIECQPYKKEYGKYDDVLDCLASLVVGPVLQSSVPSALHSLGLAHTKLQPSPMMQALHAQMALRSAMRRQGCLPPGGGFSGGRWASDPGQPTAAVAAVAALALSQPHSQLGSLQELGPEGSRREPGSEVGATAKQAAWLQQLRNSGGGTGGGGGGGGSRGSGGGAVHTASIDRPRGSSGRKKSITAQQAIDGPRSRVRSAGREQRSARSGSRRTDEGGEQESRLGLVGRRTSASSSSPSILPPIPELPMLEVAEPQESNSSPLPSPMGVCVEEEEGEEEEQGAKRARPPLQLRPLPLIPLPPMAPTQPATSLPPQHQHHNLLQPQPQPLSPTSPFAASPCGSSNSPGSTASPYGGCSRRRTAWDVEPSWDAARRGGSPAVAAALPPLPSPPVSADGSGPLPEACHRDIEGLISAAMAEGDGSNGGGSGGAGGSRDKVELTRRPKSFPAAVKPAVTRHISGKAAAHPGQGADGARRCAHALTAPGMVLSSSAAAAAVGSSSSSSSSLSAAASAVAAVTAKLFSRLLGSHRHRRCRPSDCGAGSSSAAAAATLQQEQQQQQQQQQQEQRTDAPFASLLKGGTGCESKVSPRRDSESRSPGAPPETILGPVATSAAATVSPAGGDSDISTPVVRVAPYVSQPTRGASVATLLPGLPVEPLIADAKPLRQSAFGAATMEDSLDESGSSGAAANEDDGREDVVPGILNTYPQACGAPGRTSRSSGCGSAAGGRAASCIDLSAGCGGSLAGAAGATMTTTLRPRVSSPQLLLVEPKCCAAAAAAPAAGVGLPLLPGAASVGGAGGGGGVSCGGGAAV